MFMDTIVEESLELLAVGFLVAAAFALLEQLDAIDTAHPSMPDDAARASASHP